MIHNSQDTVLSIICSFTAYYLLMSSGWTYLSYITFLVVLHFILQLREPEKLHTKDEFSVCVVGSGIAGICMGKKLNDVGIDYVILDKASSLGGTWFENIYPGIACDVPSHLYSFSFYKNPNWSKMYSPGKEIQSYLTEVASYFNVLPKMKFNTKVDNVAWIPKMGKWEIKLDDTSTIYANVLVTATGQLHVPNTPDFLGKDKFVGESFHTAEWKASFDPNGKSIGLIGTGASAVQAVPNIVKQGVKELTVFQRTPCWSFPRFEFFFSEKAKFVFQYAPFVGTTLRYMIYWAQETLFLVMICKPNILTRWLNGMMRDLTRKWYKMNIDDPELLKALTPKFPMGSKRITPSDEYVATYNKPFVHLVLDKIETFTENGIRTTNQKEYKFDTIVYATGFNMIKNANPFDIRGLDEKPLREIFEDTPKAYMGCTHPNLPNFFFLNGPGTGLGHSSMVFMIECQADYAIDGIRHLIKFRAKSFKLREDSLKRYWDWTQKQMKELVFGSHSPVTGWYRNEKGVNWTLYPGSLTRFWWTTRKFDLQDYEIRY